MRYVPWIILGAVVLLLACGLITGSLSFGANLGSNLANAPFRTNAQNLAPAAPGNVASNDNSTVGNQTSSSVSSNAPAAPVTSQPQTCGLIFPAYSGGSLDTRYDIRVDCWQEAGLWKLRGWQFRLPSNRNAHSVAIQLPRGHYVFNGVACSLFLDEQHNGKGSQNPVVASHGNNLPFDVNVDVAWALVECQGGSSSGFDYWMQ